jgi:hypothetical protein
MSHPLVVHCRVNNFDVYCGRPSKWGNPFEIGKDGTRQQVIDKYERWLLQQPELIDQLSELTGKILGCWCAPKRCHCEILAKLANN